MSPRVAMSRDSVGLLVRDYIGWWRDEAFSSVDAALDAARAALNEWRRDHGCSCGFEDWFVRGVHRYVPGRRTISALGMDWHIHDDGSCNCGGGC